MEGGGAQKILKFKNNDHSNIYVYIIFTDNTVYEKIRWICGRDTEIFRRIIIILPYFIELLYFRDDNRNT